MLKQTLEQVLAGTIDVRNLEIPELQTNVSAADYRRNVPVESVLSNDPLRHATKIEGTSFYHKLAVHHPMYRRNFEEADPRIRVRERLLVPLCQANTVLSLYGLKLYGYDGYRSRDCQAALWEFFLKAGRAKHVNLVAHDQLEQRAEEYAQIYCSKPAAEIKLDDPLTWHTHGTGGAIDVIMLTTEGAPVEFGAIFDDPSEILHTDYFERRKLTSITQESARTNRRILFWTMMAVGLVNYSGEFFHFDICTEDTATQFAIQNAACWGMTPPRTRANLGPVMAQGA